MGKRYKYKTEKPSQVQEQNRCKLQDLALQVFQNPAATKKIKDGFKYTKKIFFKALTHKNEKEKQEKKGK
jgi:hypothetical protein